MKYSDLVDVYEKLGSTSKRLEKTYYVSEALKKARKDELELLVMLLQGLVFPAWEKEKKLGFSTSYVIKVIQRVTGASESEIKNSWAKLGDLGLVAEKLVAKKKQMTLSRQELSMLKVMNNIKKLPDMEGQGSVDRKIQLISELLSSASPLEAKYIVRTVLEILRVGIGSGTMRDAITWAYFGKSHDLSYEVGQHDFYIKDRAKYNQDVSLVESAYEKINDFAQVALMAKEGKRALKNVKIVVGRPIKVMLAQRVETIEDGFEKVGQPCALEYKYDGFRIQICKDKKGKIVLYTRRMEDVTKQFPEVVEYVSKVKAESFVLDAEAVGYNSKTKKYTPFQSISQRIRRKYEIQEMSKDFPVEVNVFDVLYLDGKSYIAEPYKERRKMIEKIVPTQEYKIRPSHCLITDNVNEAKDFYSESKKKGMEGVMMKNLESPYKPGSRVGQWVKLKPTMETLDLCIVGAEWGEGKRSGWFTSFTLACLDEAGDFRTIGKVGTGIKELEESEGVTFKELTEMLKPLVISEKGREVQIKPEIIVEIKFEEIQVSPKYTSKYALRFPRVARLREDRGAEDASTLELVHQLYSGQKK